MPLPELPEIEDSTLVFEDFLKIRRDRLIMPNRTKYDHFCVLTKETSVVVCAQVSDQKWILTEEYRHPTGKFILGLPGGYLDDQEDPLAGGQRELLEETGYSSDQLILLGSAYPYAGVSGQLTYFVLAKQAYQKKAPTPEPTELLHIKLKTTQEIHELLRQGYPLDANLCTALYFVHLHHSM